MCCTLHQARLTDTKLFGGIVEHPELGTVHVMGYSNRAQNLHNGPNCMIIPIPAGEPITAANFIDTKQTRGVLNSMSRTVWPPMPSMFPSRSMLFGARIGASARDVVHQAEHGIYTVQWTVNAKLIPEAIQNVPVEKRPTNLNPAYFEDFDRKYPGHTITVWCWDARWEIEADPVFIRYYAMDGYEKIWVPATDAHNGEPPVIGEMVWVDHEVFASWPGMEGGVEMTYPESMSAEVRAFMPDRVAGAKYFESMPNGDFVISCDEPLGNQLRKTSIERRPPPGATEEERRKHALLV